MISLIWAMDENNVIGKNNMLPWHYKEDLKYFRACIKNHKVLLGFHTYESLLSYRKTLFPDSTYYLVTRKKMRFPDATVVGDLKGFLEEKRDEEIFVIGGSSIYEACLPYADKLYVTIVKGVHDGDAFFPKIDYSKYKLISKKPGEDPDLTFLVYERF